MLANYNSHFRQANYEEVIETQRLSQMKERFPSFHPSMSPDWY